MKASYYNIFFPYEDKRIGYNSLSDKFIILEPILHELFLASINENQINALRDVHNDFFETLISNGFIVNSEVNELAEIKRISYETDFNEDNYELTINPTMNCNFKCWYCYETHIKDSKMSDETLDKVRRFIENILEEKGENLKNFNLQWFGGEPLLYFYKTVLPLLQWIYPIMKGYNINFISGFTTNGLLITQQLLDECVTYGVKHFQITLDGHRDRHNKVRFISESKGSYDEIVSNIKLCLKNKVIVTARINISEETITDLLKIIDDFQDITLEDREYITFSFHEVWQEEKDLKADISNIVEEFRLHGLNTGYIGESTASIKNSCYADKLNHATINYNGDVYKCTARDYTESSREGVLEEEGIISWNDKFQKRIYDTRFQNKPCLECTILPICNGGCSQHRIENSDVDYCVYNFDQEIKMNIVKEKFYSRMILSAPKNFESKVAKSLLNITFNKFGQHEPEIFQNSLDRFFQVELNSADLIQIQEMNKYYADALLELRKNQINSYNDIIKKIDVIFSKLKLNNRQVKVTSLFALPVLAYYEYKLGNFDKAIELTNRSIENDDHFLPNHPFLYGHKIQQLHNTMRILIKDNKLEEAFLIANQTLNHLMFGEKLDYSIGEWKEDYNIKNDCEMEGMVFQIITETVGVITNTSNNITEEERYFSIAFNNLDRESVIVTDNQKNNEILLIKSFLSLKKDLYNSSTYNENEIIELRKKVDTSKYAFMCYPLFKSLFLSLKLSSYNESKIDFDKAYI